MDLELREDRMSSLPADVNSSLHYDRYEFLITNMEAALPCLVILVFATVVGTFGNVLIILSVLSRKNLQKVESIFIVNLAFSDLYVTSIADPMSIIAKIEGVHFFDKLPGLCQAVASICTISCVTSLMTIAVMSINRYFYICAHERYRIIFKKWNCICICISLYLVGGILVLLNIANIGDHGFDRKSLECIWDRMATFPYTVVFSIVLVWLPSIVTGFCYLQIYLYVRGHHRRIREQNHPTASSPFLKSFHLARTLFIIYAVFITCWAPYALLIVIDSKDTFAHEIHLYITMFAHLHPSLNWFIYYITNKKFADAYKVLLSKCKLCHKNISDISCDVMNTNTVVPCTKSRQSYHSKPAEFNCQQLIAHTDGEDCLTTTKLHTITAGDNPSFQSSQRNLMESNC